MVVKGSVLRKLTYSLHKLLGQKLWMTVMMCSNPGDGLVRPRSATGKDGLKGGQLGVVGLEEWFAEDCVCVFLAADGGLDSFLSFPITIM